MYQRRLRVLAANGKATNLFNGVHTAERNVVKRTFRGIWRINDLALPREIVTRWPNGPLSNNNLNNTDALQIFALPRSKLPIRITIHDSLYASLLFFFVARAGLSRRSCSYVANIVEHFRLEHSVTIGNDLPIGRVSRWKIGKNFLISFSIDFESFFKCPKMGANR